MKPLSPDTKKAARISEEEVNHATSSHNKGRDRFSKKLKHGFRQEFGQITLESELQESARDERAEEQQKDWNLKFV